MKPKTIRMLRWIARIFSLVNCLIIVLIYIGEGFNPAILTQNEWLGLFFFPIGVIAGLLLAFRREVAGSVLALCSLVAFYFWNVVSSGRFPGGTFAMLASPAVLFILVWLFERQPKPEEKKV